MKPDSFFSEVVMGEATVSVIKDRVVVIKLSGEVVSNTVKLLKDIQSEELEKGLCQFVIDLTGCNYINSRGIGALVSRLSEARRNDGDVRLVSVNDVINESLKITNLDKVFKIFETQDAAISSYEE